MAKGTVRPLTASSSNDGGPCFSPDGRFLYFARQASPDHAWEIWVLDVDKPERNRKFLAKDGVSYQQPTLSPDLKRVAMTQTPHGGRPRLAIGDVTKDHISNVRAFAEAGGIADAHPAWSPDGAWIAFHRYEGASGHTSHLYKVRPDGRGITPIVERDDLCKHAAWASDEYIVYQRTSPEGARTLHLITASGESLGDLTSGEALDKHPHASVDREGTVLVAFASRLPGEETDPDHTWDVYAATIETVRAQVKRRRR
jgi:Tol biopolymer transport system component